MSMRGGASPQDLLRACVSGVVRSKGRPSLVPHRPLGMCEGALAAVACLAELVLR